MPLQTLRRALGRWRSAKTPTPLTNPHLHRGPTAEENDTTDPDIYTPLDESHRQIRLLRMFPYEEGDISLELEVASLDDAPVYKALSYLWTTAEADCRIRVNDQPFWVRPNLYHYLELMRREDDEGLIFIDAICINQSDIAERSSQVALMRDVYKQADLVVVWLGAGTRWFEPGLPSMTVDEVRKLYDGEGDLASRTAHILYVFVLAEYWTRVWIIQEILLARALVFRVGPVRASPNALLALYSDLDRLLGRALLEFFESVGRSSESFVPPGLRDHQVWPLYHTYSLIKQWDDNAGANDGAWQPRAIADVFTSFPSQACSLAHDKIYGLLGLTDSVCRVNYAAPTLELFLRLLIESTFAPVSLGYLEGSNNHDHHLCIALLSGLGLRVEAPAVHYAILRGLDLCGVRAATTPMTYRPLLHRIQRSARLHPRLIPAYANALQALTEHRVRFHQRFRNLRLPAVDTFETRSLDELDRFVCDIFEDVQAQILCARRHYRFRMLAASAWKPEDRPWRYVYLPAE